MIFKIVWLCNFALLIYIATRFFSFDDMKFYKTRWMCIGLLLLHISIMLPLMKEEAEVKSGCVLMLMVDALTIYAFYKMQDMYDVDDKKRESVEKKADNDVNVKEEKNKAQQNKVKSEPVKEDKTTVNRVERYEAKKNVKEVKKTPLFIKKVTLFKLFDVLKIEELFTKSQSFEDFVDLIDERIENDYINSKIEYQYHVWNKVFRSAKGITLAYHYLLENPDIAKEILGINEFDEINKTIEIINEKLVSRNPRIKTPKGIPSALEIAAFEKESILEIFEGGDRNQIDFLTLLFWCKDRSDVEKEMAELYSLYTSFSEEESFEIISKIYKGKMNLLKHKFPSFKNPGSMHLRTYLNWKKVDHKIVSHSDDPLLATDKIFEFLGNNFGNYIFNSKFYYDNDEDRVGMDHRGNFGGYFKGYESENEIYMHEWWNESYHDGGGSSSTTVSLVFCDSINVPDYLQQGDRIDEFIIPGNDGYWRDGECLFLLNPLGLSGVYSYFYEDDYKHSYESCNEISSIGVSNVDSYYKKER